jgi:GTP cyclohydrolase I
MKFSDKGASMFKLKSSEQTQTEIIAYHFEEIMLALGLNLNDPSLAKTPARVAKMYVEELFSGLNPENFPSLTFFENVGGSQNMVMTQASVASTCEHHFVPMMGVAHIAYLPHRKLIGLSKIPRIVRYFAKRPQVQERLTDQIAACLIEQLETEHVAVSTTLEHTCVKARGIEDEGSITTVNVLHGAFKSDPKRQNEFFHSINNDYSARYCGKVKTFPQ